MRQVIFVIKKSIQKSKTAEKKHNKAQMYDKKKQNFLNNKTQQKPFQEISEKNSYKLSISISRTTSVGQPYEFNIFIPSGKSTIAGLRPLNCLFTLRIQR